MRILPYFLAFTLVGGSAWAQQQPITFTPKVVLKPEKSIGPDVVGLLPGMTEPEVAQAIAAHMPDVEVRVEKRFFQVGSRGVTVRTTEAVNVMTAVKADNNSREEVAARFSGEAAGSQAISLFRSIVYNNVLAAPAASDVYAALVKKLGEPSYKSDGDVPQLMIWTLKGGRTAPCQAVLYNTPNYCHLIGSYEPQFFQTIIEEKRRSLYDGAIKVQIQKHSNDRSRLYSVMMDYTDLSRMASSAQTDSKTLLDQLNKSHEQQSVAVAAPKF